MLYFVWETILSRFMFRIFKFPFCKLKTAPMCTNVLGQGPVLPCWRLWCPVLESTFKRVTLEILGFCAQGGTKRNTFLNCICSTMCNVIWSQNFGGKKHINTNGNETQMAFVSFELHKLKTIISWSLSMVDKGGTAGRSSEGTSEDDISEVIEELLV